MTSEKSHRHGLPSNNKGIQTRTPSRRALPLSCPVPSLLDHGRYHQYVPRTPSSLSFKTLTAETTHAGLLPDSLKLPPHLSAHKYFFVCSLTVAAWDTLVLSPRTWKLLRTKEWPPLKIIYHFIRLFMPICFTVTGSPQPTSQSMNRLPYPSLFFQPSSSSTQSGHKR